jgi:hypothetical protein
LVLFQYKKQEWFFKWKKIKTEILDGISCFLHQLRFFCLIAAEKNGDDFNVFKRE